MTTKNEMVCVCVGGGNQSDIVHNIYIKKKKKLTCSSYLSHVDFIFVKYIHFDSETCESDFLYRLLFSLIPSDFIKTLHMHKEWIYL